MFIRERGDGAAVLMIPGCPMPADHFSELAGQLANTHRVLLPDLPGYGDTAPQVDHNLERTTELLERTMIERGISELSIIGASLGAHRAAALALSGRLRVTALYSIGGFVHLPDEARVAFGQFAAAVRGGHVRELEDVFISRMLSTAFIAANADIADRVKSWLYLTSTDVLAAELDAIAELPDLRARVTGLPVGIVARVGELDAAAPPALSEAIALAAPDAEVELAPRCGHLLLLEDREATHASIRRWLMQPS